MIVLIIGHFLIYAKFRGKGQILLLGLKFRNPRKTVGPNHYANLCVGSLVITCKKAGMIMVKVLVVQCGMSVRTYLCSAFIIVIKDITKQRIPMIC